MAAKQELSPGVPLDKEDTSPHEIQNPGPPPTPPAKMISHDQPRKAPESSP